MIKKSLKEREHTLQVVRELNKLIAQSAIGINWTSDELLTSSTERQSRRHGPGEEERGTKRYEPGDNPRNIHLPATLASTDPDEIIMRTFFQSRVLRFNVLLNVGASMHFGTHNTLKTRLGAACAGAGLHSATLVQDIPSFITYGNRPLTVRLETVASDLLFEGLLHFVEDGEKAEKVPQGGGLAKAYASIRHLDRTVTLVVDDFAHMSAADWEALRLLGIQHDVIAAFVQDPRERELPEVPWPGASYSLEDCLGTAKSLWITASAKSGIIGSLVRRLTPGAIVTSRAQYAENFRQHEQNIVARLKKCGITPVVVSTDKAKDDVRKLLRVLARRSR